MRLPSHWYPLKPPFLVILAFVDMFQALFSFSKLIITFIAIKASFQRSCYHWNLLCVLLWKLDEIWWYRCCLTMITISVNSLITITSYFFQLFVHLSVLLLCLIQGVFFTGPALKVLSMELVPPNKEIDWFCHKSSKHGRKENNWFCPTHWKRQSL